VETPEAFYRTIADENDETIRRLTRRINVLALLRLGLAAGWIAVLIAARAAGYGWITLTFALPFTALMVWHERLARRKRYAATWAKLCRNELKGLEGDYTAFDGASERADGDHPFSVDLDLFGPESLFQAMNRTVTRGGRDRLAEGLLDPLRDKRAILDRQRAVAELARESALRHRFQVTGSL
jgi:hypothetical protein